AEDPRARVDHDVAGSQLVARLVDLPDRAVERLDLEPAQVEVGIGLLTERPDLDCSHLLAPFFASLVFVPRGTPAVRARNQRSRPGPRSGCRPRVATTCLRAATPRFPK